MAKKKLGNCPDDFFETLRGGYYFATEHPHQVAQLIDAVAMAPAYDKELSWGHLQTQFWHPAIAMSFCTHSSAICIQSYGKFMVQLWHIFA